MVTKTREIKPIDPKKYKTCESCGKYIVGDVCHECADNEEIQEE